MILLGFSVLLACSTEHRSLEETSKSRGLSKASAEIQFGRPVRANALRLPVAVDHYDSHESEVRVQKHQHVGAQRPKTTPLR